MLIESHRGSPVGAPNSLVAVRAGLASPADSIEVDVQMTADRELVCFHHFTVSDKHWVHEMTASELRSRLADLGVPEPPALDVVAKEVMAAGKLLNVDVKSGFAEESVPQRETARALVALDATERSWISDWDQPSLAAVKRELPAVRIRPAIRGRLVDPVSMLLAIGADAVNLAWDTVGPADVAAIQQAGIGVAFYGGWGDRYVSHSIRSGVDIICVDDAERTAAEMARATDHG